MNVLNVLTGMLDHLLRAVIDFVLWSLTGFEKFLRDPLEQSGIHGVLQTLILTMIPILCLVAVVKLFGGVIRLALLIVCVLVLAHMVLPIVLSGTVRAA